MSAPSSASDWRLLYTAAMLELDSTRLQPKIEHAHCAIRARLMELPETSSNEKAELQSALNYLRRLKASQVSG
jgi:hypothetical protein